MKRRSLLKGIAGILIPAPMVVQASSLMKVKPLLFLGDRDFTMEFIIEVPGESSEHTKWKHVVFLNRKGKHEMYLSSRRLAPSNPTNVNIIRASNEVLFYCPPPSKGKFW